MTFECPYGWKSVAKIGSHITFESATVNICDGICDSCDLCGNKACEFYDRSPEADRRFARALAHEQTLEYKFTKLH